MITMTISVSYPQLVKLEDGKQIELTNETWEKRLLVVESDKTEYEVRQIFKKEGFENAGIREFIKNGQLGSGLIKKIKDWQIHVRFFTHNNRIQIDGEVEVSNDYFEHLTHGWISAFKESWNIVLKHFGKLWVFHKGHGKYVIQVLREGVLSLSEPKSKTDWVALGLTLFVVIAAGAVIASAVKK